MYLLDTDTVIYILKGHQRSNKTFEDTLTTLLNCVSPP